MEKNKKIILESFQEKNIKKYQKISIRLRIEDEENEVNIISSWDNVSDIDRKTLFSKLYSITPLLKRFDEKYGEEGIKITTEDNGEKIKVNAEIGDNKIGFVLDTIDEDQLFTEISKKVGINIE